MSGYIGQAPSIYRDTQNRVSYVAAEGQTTFAADYTPGYVDVYQNGLKLDTIGGTDVTAINGTSIVLATPAVLGDSIEIVAIKTSNPYDVYTKAQADLRNDNYYGVALGTGDAMTVTLTPTPASLVDGMEFKIRVPAANTLTNPALTVMGLGLSKTIYVGGGQAVPANTYTTNQEITLRYNGTGDRFELVNSSRARVPQLQFISASVAANALTLTLNPTLLDFRSPSLTSGVVNSRLITNAISIVVPSSATLGTLNATAARLALLALDNNGTVELAVVNLAGGNNLDETTLISTTALSAASTANNVVYSTNARTSLPFRVVGFIDITETTAGVWAAAPTTIQGSGGQALTAMQSIGYGQTWQNFTGSRSAATTYYNLTGRPIFVAVTGYHLNAGSVTLTINGVLVGTQGASIGGAPNVNLYTELTGIVPPSGSYSVAVSAASINNWAELR